jgi:hypothetical protein
VPDTHYFMYATCCVDASAPTSVGLVDLNVGESIMSLGYSKKKRQSRLRAEAVCIYIIYMIFILLDNNLF